MTDEKDVEQSPQTGAAEEPQKQADAAALDSPDEARSDAEGVEVEADGEADDLAESGPIDEAEGEAAAEPCLDDDFKVQNQGDASEDDAEAAMLEMLEGLPDEHQGASPEDINFGAAPVSGAEFQQLQQPASSAEEKNIDLLMDVDLPVSIELGRTKMAIADILSLGPGSVVELAKLAGEPADLLINYKVVARGEVVVVDENFGLRITQLMTPEERLRALAEE